MSLFECARARVIVRSLLREPEQKRKELPPVAYMYWHELHSYIRSPILQFEFGFLLLFVCITCVLRFECWSYAFLIAVDVVVACCCIFRHFRLELKLKVFLFFKAVHDVCVNTEKKLIYIPSFIAWQLSFVFFFESELKVSRCKQPHNDFFM